MLIRWVKTSASAPYHAQGQGRRQFLAAFRTRAGSRGLSFALGCGGREAGHGLGGRVTFDESVAGVRGEAMMTLAAARGPGNLDAINFAAGSQAKMKTGVARREIAASAEPRGDLSPARDSDSNSRSDGIPVRGGPFEPERDEMVLGLGPIVEQGERNVLGDEQQIDAAVVVQVADRESAP